MCVCLSFHFKMTKCHREMRESGISMMACACEKAYTRMWVTRLVKKKDQSKWEEKTKQNK